MWEDKFVITVLMVVITGTIVGMETTTFLGFATILGLTAIIAGRQL